MATPRALLTLVVLACAGACASAPVEHATLQFAYTASAGYPVSLVRIVGGAGQELALDASRFHSTNGALVTDTLALPPATRWPLRIMLISTPGDTLGVAATTIRLESARLVTIGLFVSKLDRSFACAPVLAAAPIRTSQGNADTLYVVSWGPLAETEHPPPC